MYQIRKTFGFSASHQLNGLPAGHQCARLHGHNYRVEIVLESPVLNEHGFVVDYGELRQFKEMLDNNYDHQHLNAVVSFNPTAENLARHFFEVARALWPQTVSVRVSETEATWAEYSGPCSACMPGTHYWVTHRDPNTPDGPGDIHVYCGNCGQEKQDDD